MNLGKKIISGMPKGLSDLEKARYLYLALCRELCFSTEYQNVDDARMSEIHMKKVYINSLHSKSVNCRMWAMLYSQLLDMVGIRNEIIDQGHSYVEFVLEGKKWVADATHGTYTDLARTKNNDETVGFGLSVFQKVDKHANTVVIDDEISSLLEQIDRKIGQSIDKKNVLLKFKDYLRQIKEGKVNLCELSVGSDIQKGNEHLFKLEYLFSVVGRLNDGYYEQKDFIYKLEKLILNEEELKKVGAVELKRNNIDKTVDIVQCIYVSGVSGMNYYLLSPNMPIKKCDESQILKLALMGFGKEEKEIPGIIYPKNFKRGKKSYGYKYKLYRFLVKFNLISEEQIFTEIEDSQRRI